MRRKFIGAFALSWFFLTWAPREYLTKSDPLSWHGCGRDLTTWSLSRSRMQSDHFLSNTEAIWTQSQPPGCHMCQKASDRMTSITMPTGLLCPSRKKSSHCQLDSSCSSFSYTGSTPTIQLTFCCMEALRPYLASTANCSSSTGSYNQIRDTTSCSFQNKASPFRTERQSLPTVQGREGDNDHVRFAPHKLQGHGHCLQSVTSLPGPDSRDGSEATRLEHCTKRHRKQQQLSKAPVDVRVGGTVGQQPPEAHQGVRHDISNHANHLKQTFKTRDPEGTTFVGRPALQELVDVHSSTIQTCRQTSKGSSNHRPIPPRALAGTMILLVALLLKPVSKQAPKHRWQVTRIIRGTYRRRLSSVTRKQSQQPPTHRKSAGTRPPSGRLLGIFILLLLLSCAHASPNQTSRMLRIQAEQARGYTTLCAKKHSFQRAQRQALLQGTAVYRGRRMTDRQLGVTWSANVPKKSARAKASDATPRIRVVTWNSGGHNLVRQAEVRTWLESESKSNPVHVLCIQETHWPCSSEYRDGPWTCVHSGSGSREGGILFMVNTEYFSGLDIKHAEVHPGRLLHLRICSDPAIDLLGVYQHAWNPAKAEFQNRQQTPEQLLLGKRQIIWQRVQSWISGVPRRNLLGIMGDFNSTLEANPPNVGNGVGHAHTHKTDAQALQSLLQTAGLMAANTWGKPGHAASTFWTHKGEGSQIDFIITRNPVNQASLKSSTLPQAPIVHPTGFRHIPVQCYFTWPKPPQRQKQSIEWTASRVNQASARCPQLLARFRAQLDHMSCTAEQLNASLLDAWQRSQQPVVQLPLAASHPDRICLKTFWEVKRRLRVLANTSLEGYVILHPLCPASTFQNVFSTTRRYAQHLLRCWQHSCQIPKAELCTQGEKPASPQAEA